MLKETIYTKGIVVCLAFVFLATSLSVLAIGAKAVPYESVTGIGDIPSGRNGVATFVADGTLYVMGGSSNPMGGGTIYSEVIRFGLENKTVSYGTPMPNGRWSPIYTMGNDGNMYLFGGFNGGYLSDVQIYNPLNNTWWTRAAPSAFGVGAAVTLANGTIVIFNGAWSTKTNMYFPTTDTWLTMSSTPSGIIGQRSAVVLNTSAVLVMGGGNGGTTTSAICEIFNPIANTWTTVASLPLDSAFGGAVMGNNGFVYYIAGFYGNGWPPATARSQIQRYDVEEDAWTVIASTVGTAKSLFGTAQDQNGRTFIAAGLSAASVEQTTIQMILAEDLEETNNVVITSPGAGSVVSDVVAVSAMLTSRTSGVDPLIAEFFVDGGLVDNAIGSSTIRAWTFVWDTVGLTDGSMHTLMVRVLLDNGNITDAAIQVIVSAKNVDQKIADLENQISLLQSDLNTLRANTNASDTSAAQNISALQNQIAALQNQLTTLQGTTGSAKDSAASANTFAMIGMLVAIIVLILVVINMIMSRSKK